MSRPSTSSSAKPVWMDSICDGSASSFWARRAILQGLACVVLGALGVVSLAKASASHPFHVCIGQMQWNAAEGFWEVSLRMQPQDLEKAMSSEFGEVISVEDKDFQERAVAYLNTQFLIWRRPESETLARVTDALTEVALPRGLRTDESDAAWPEDRSRLKWVGMEQEKGWIWLHFEMLPPKDAVASSNWLVHRVFLETVERQENSVSILPTRATRYSLQFKKGTPAQQMRPMP